MRNPVPDFLKGIAVLLMIQVHVAEILLKPQFYSDWIGQVALFLGGLPAAPIFMVIMGYYLGKSKSQGWKFIVRSAYLFGGGVLLNIGLNFSLLITQWVEPIPFEGYSAWNYIFGVDILLFAGLATLIIGFLKKLVLPKPYAWMALAVAVVVVSQLMPIWFSTQAREGYVMAFVSGSSFWSYFPLFPWLAYPLTGIAFALFEEQYKIYPSFVRNAAGTFALLYFAWQFASAFAVSIDLHTYYHHGLEFYLWALAGMALWALAVKWLLGHLAQNLLLKQVCRIGKRVTIIYVIQWLLIGNLATLGWYKTLSPIQYLVWSVLLIIASSVLGWLWLQLYARLRHNPGVI